MKESTCDSILYIIVVGTFAIFTVNVFIHADWKTFYANLDYVVVSEWIKEHSNRNDTILTAPNSIYPAFTERQSVICEPMSQTSFLYGTGEFDINNYSNYNYSVCK